MKKLLLLFFAILITSCSTQKDQSIKIGVDQTIRIPVQYITISTGIVERGTDVTRVEKSGYEKLAKVVGLLKEFGYDKKNLKINSGEVSDRMYGEKPYEFSSSVRFDLGELDKVDTFRRALTKAGATQFRVASFNNSKEDSIYDAAYQNAINKAKYKAAKLLKNQDVEVGEILNLHENVKETIDVTQTYQMAEPPPIKVSNDAIVESVVPLFNRKFYSRSIEFTIEFSLKEK